jgi:uncharacterized membrane protein YqiK
MFDILPLFMFDMLPLFMFVAVVVVVVVVLVLALALLSVVEQPAQKAATVSKANIAKVLRIDFLL